MHVSSRFPTARWRAKCWSIATTREQRLVYAVKSERLTQHSASAQVFAEGDGRSRLVWIVDVLPNEVAPYMNAQMDQGAAAMQKALGRNAA